MPKKNGGSSLQFANTLNQIQNGWNFVDDVFKNIFLKWNSKFPWNMFPIRKSKDYVYGIWVYKALDIWKGYYRVKKITGFVRETVNRGKK